LKTIFLLQAATAVILLALVVVTGAASAQTPSLQGQPTQGSPPGMNSQERNYPKPTNLKVLPNTLSGKGVRDIMEKWAGSLGVHCDNCHTADPTHLGPNGRPRLNFPDDSKPDKQIARLMYTMTQEINQDTIRKAMQLDPDDDGMPVTCGTCHRGHKMPEEFVIPKQEGPSREGSNPQSGSQKPSPGL
jgi:cytochrome c553